MTCIMTGKVVMEYSEPQPSPDNSTEQILYDPVQVATTVSMAVGIVEVSAAGWAGRITSV